MSTTHVQRVQQYALRQAKYAHLNAFISTADPKDVIQAAKKADGQSSASPLHGKIIAIKDNIATRTLRTTAASKILEPYTSPYDATVVTTLLSAGAILAGKTNLDEFGMGSHSRSPFSGAVQNQYHRHDSPLSAGGSSGGSAVAVATGQCWAALGTDTGGSVRLPAAYTGVVGFKPSYGRLSRWGVVAYANSLDTVGTLTSNVDDAKEIYQCLNHHDARDPTSLSVSLRTRIQQHILATRGDTTARLKKLRIGVPGEYNIASLSGPVKSTWIRLLQALQTAGHTLHSVSLPATRQALSTYYTLAPAEASSNLAKYDGVRYGHRTSGAADANSAEDLPLFAQTRGEAFGEEVRKRVLLGAYTLSSEARDNYFGQAQKVRRVVQGDFDRVFALGNPLHDNEVDAEAVALDTEAATTLGTDEAHMSSDTKIDVLIVPTAPTLPPTLQDVEQQSRLQNYMNDVFTVPASLAGLPAVSIPVRIMSGQVPPEEEGEEVRTVGMQVVGQFGDDEFVLGVGALVESVGS